MERFKFKFRTRCSFDSKYDYENVFAVIERIKSRCPEYRIHESFERHPANAFDGMSLPDNDNEEYIRDHELLFFDSADNLIELNKTLSGKYGWDSIADVIDTQTGVGINNWHWTLHTYKLKPEYSQLLIDSLNELEKEIRKNYEIFLSEEKKKEDEREAIRNSIASIETSEKSIWDERGKTKEYTHIITFHDGERLTFIERSVFDVGIIINPSYSVVPGSKPGGVCLNRDGVLKWYKFVKNEGWIPIRSLTENEITAMNYLRVFGKYARSGVRMKIIERPSVNGRSFLAILADIKTNN